MIRLSLSLSGAEVGELGEPFPDELSTPPRRPRVLFAPSRYKRALEYGSAAGEEDKTRESMGASPRDRSRGFPRLRARLQEVLEGGGEVAIRRGLLLFWGERACGVSGRAER